MAPPEGTALFVFGGSRGGCRPAQAQFLAERGELAVVAGDDYLIIPGDIEMEWEIEGYVFDANASAPDVFLFGGTARFSF